MGLNERSEKKNMLDTRVGLGGKACGSLGHSGSPRNKGPAEMPLGREGLGTAGGGKIKAKKRKRRKAFVNGDSSLSPFGSILARVGLSGECGAFLIGRDSVKSAGSSRP